MTIEKIQNLKVEVQRRSFTIYVRDVELPIANEDLIHGANEGQLHIAIAAGRLLIDRTALLITILEHRSDFFSGDSPHTVSFDRYAALSKSQRETCFELYRRPQFDSSIEELDQWRIDVQAWLEFVDETYGLMDSPFVRTERWWFAVLGKSKRWLQLSHLLDIENPIASNYTE